MGDPLKNQLFKLKNTTYGTLIFFLVSNPNIYYFTKKIFNFNTCRNISMVILHSIIYFFILLGVMYFPE